MKSVLAWVHMLWDWHSPELKVSPPPDNNLPRDYVAITGTVAPSARAMNELLDYWRGQAAHWEAAQKAERERSQMTRR